MRHPVSDTGVGMDAEALARAFEPYFSTKATGTGLGLPIAKRNVELSGGTIAIASERGRGHDGGDALPLGCRSRDWSELPTRCVRSALRSLRCSVVAGGASVAVAAARRSRVQAIPMKAEAR